MKTRLKLLCWLPLVGVLFDALIVFIYKENYLSDTQKPLRFMNSCLYHALFAVALLMYFFPTLLQ